MDKTTHKTEGANRTRIVRFHPHVFTGNAPRKGKRIPLNKIKNNEQRDEETGYDHFGARYIDHELMTMWLSVDPMADKYPFISPHAYCAWNPVKLVEPDGRELVLTGESSNVNSLLKIINEYFSFSTDVFKVVGGKMQSSELAKDEIYYWS